MKFKIKWILVLTLILAVVFSFSLTISSREKTEAALEAVDDDSFHAAFVPEKKRKALFLGIYSPFQTTIDLSKFPIRYISFEYRSKVSKEEIEAISKIKSLEKIEFLQPQLNQDLADALMLIPPVHLSFHKSDLTKTDLIDRLKSRHAIKDKLH